MERTAGRADRDREKCCFGEHVSIGHKREDHTPSKIAYTLTPKQRLHTRSSWSSVHSSDSPQSSQREAQWKADLIELERVCEENIERRLFAVPIFDYAHIGWDATEHQRAFDQRIQKALSVQTLT